MPLPSGSGHDKKRVSEHSSKSLECDTTRLD